MSFDVFVTRVYNRFRSVEELNWAQVTDDGFDGKESMGWAFAKEQKYENRQAKHK